MEKIERILGLLLLVICNISAIIVCIGLAFTVLTTIEDYNANEEKNKYEIKQLEKSNDLEDYLKGYNDELDKIQEDSILLK